MKRPGASSVRTPAASKGARLRTRVKVATNESNGNRCWAIGSTRPDGKFGILATAHRCPEWMARTMAEWLGEQLVQGEATRAVKLVVCSHDLEAYDSPEGA